MSIEDCVHGRGPGCLSCKDKAHEDAKEAVIQAAKKWHNSNPDIDGIGYASELLYSTRKLMLLEQPADPVKAFVEYCGSEDCDWSEHGARLLGAAQKALGMEKK